MQRCSPCPVMAGRQGHDGSFKRLAGGCSATWWRREDGRNTTAVDGRHASKEGERRPGRAAFLRRMRGRCFRCLSSKHHIASCRGPKVCWLYEHAGHLAKDCNRPPRAPNHPRHRTMLVSPLRSFASVLMSPMRELDVCITEAKEVVLACERCYKGSVDGALSEENERGGLMLLLPQDKDGDREPIMQGPLQDRPSPTWHEFLDELSARVLGPVSACSPILADRGPGEGLAMVLCSPVDTRCEQVLLSDNEEMGPELGEHATGMEDGHHSEGSFDTLAGHGQQDLAVGTPRCLLSSFIASISTPIEASVLGMPATALVHEMEMEAPTVRRSVRFAKQHPNGANMEQLAKEADDYELVNPKRKVMM